MIRYVKINISFLIFSIVFVLVNFYSNNANAYNCYGTSNAGTVAPDNGTVCANMYIVPSTSGGGAIKLKNATLMIYMWLSLLYCEIDCSIGTCLPRSNHID